MSQVARVSKSGVNVLTATNPNDFIFNSDLNTFKILAEATYSPTLGTTATNASVSVAHGRSGTPFVIAFCKFSNGRVGPVGSKASNAEFYFNDLSVNSLYINFNYSNFTGGNYSPIFKYYIVEPPL